MDLVLVGLPTTGARSLYYYYYYYHINLHFTMGSPTSITTLSHGFSSIDRTLGMARQDYYHPSSASLSQ